MNFLHQTKNNNKFSEKNRTCDFFGYPLHGLNYSLIVNYFKISSNYSLVFQQNIACRAFSLILEYFMNFLTPTKNKYRSCDFLTYSTTYATNCLYVKISINLSLVGWFGK